MDVRSPFQRNPTDCGASLYDLETSRMKRLRPAFGHSTTGKIKLYTEDCEINHLGR
jgi:hypothetical protein